MKRRAKASVNLEALTKLCGHSSKAERLMSLWACAGNDPKLFRERALGNGYSVAAVDAFLNPDSEVNFS